MSDTMEGLRRRISRSCYDAEDALEALEELKHKLNLIDPSSDLNSPVEALLVSLIQAVRATQKETGVWREIADRSLNVACEDAEFALNQWRRSELGELPRRF